jgi:hypothetical protein
MYCMNAKRDKFLLLHKSCTRCAIFGNCKGKTDNENDRFYCPFFAKKNIAIFVQFQIK